MSAAQSCPSAALPALHPAAFESRQPLQGTVLQAIMGQSELQYLTLKTARAPASRKMPAGRGALGNAELAAVVRPNMPILAEVLQDLHMFTQTLHRTAAQQAAFISKL